MHCCHQEDRDAIMVSSFLDVPETEFDTEEDGGPCRQPQPGVMMWDSQILIWTFPRSLSLSLCGFINGSFGVHNQVSPWKQVSLPYSTCSSFNRYFRSEQSQMVQGQSMSLYCRAMILLKSELLLIFLHLYCHKRMIRIMWADVWADKGHETGL